MVVRKAVLILGRLFDAMALRKGRMSLDWVDGI